MLTIGLLLAGCQADQPATAAATVRIDHGLKPLNIGVATAQQDVWEALQRANELFPTAQGRPVRLRLERGSDLYESARALSPASDALIVAGAPRRSAEFANFDKPVYFTSPLEACDEPLLRSSSLAAGELAQRAASFILKEFKPAKVAVVLDQASEVSVRDASRLAAALTRQGGRLGGSVYLDGPRSNFADLAERLEAQDIAALAVPYSGEVTVRLIKELRDQHCRIPVVVINPPDEKAFGTRWRHHREKLYIVSQFAAERAGGGRAQAYLEACAAADAQLNAARALAVDSYFMALDAGTPVPEEYLAGELTQAEGACPQRDCYVYRVKGRKLELIEVLKSK